MDRTKYACRRPFHRKVTRKFSSAGSPPFALVKTMSGRDVRVFGRRFACPGCHALLRFQRPPTSLLQTCPNCRKVLKLQERQAAANHDEELKAALDSLSSWKPKEKKNVEYNRDPRLDVIDDSISGLWQFDQPWPAHTGDVVLDRVEVLVDAAYGDEARRQRHSLLHGYHRRVSVFRTGEVEEIAVTGHWWEHRDHQSHEGSMGALPRPVVRELNRIPSTPAFAARINCFRQTPESNILELFIDLAIDNTPRQKKKTRRFR